MSQINPLSHITIVLNQTFIVLTQQVLIWDRREVQMIPFVQQ